MADAIRAADLFATLVREDTYAVASEVHDLLVKTHSSDVDKIAEIKALVAEHLDVDRILDVATPRRRTTRERAPRTGPRSTALRRRPAERARPDDAAAATFSTADFVFVGPGQPRRHPRGRRPSPAFQGVDARAPSAGCGSSWSTRSSTATAAALVLRMTGRHRAAFAGVEPSRRAGGPATSSTSSGFERRTDRRRSPRISTPRTCDGSSEAPDDLRADGRASADLLVVDQADVAEADRHREQRRLVDVVELLESCAAREATLT